MQVALNTGQSLGKDHTKAGRQDRERCQEPLECSNESKGAQGWDVTNPVPCVEQRFSASSHCAAAVCIMP